MHCTHGRWGSTENPVYSLFYILYIYHLGHLWQHNLYSSCIKKKDVRRVLRPHDQTLESFSLMPELGLPSCLLSAPLCICSFSYLTTCCLIWFKLVLKKNQSCSLWFQVFSINHQVLAGHKGWTEADLIQGAVEMEMQKSPYKYTCSPLLCSEAS